MEGVPMPPDARPVPPTAGLHAHRYRSPSALSNVALRVVDALAAHVLPAMLDEGLRVCLNSDDPARFGGYIDDNLEAVRRELGPADAQPATLARTPSTPASSPRTSGSAGRPRWVTSLRGRN